MIYGTIIFMEHLPTWKEGSSFSENGAGPMANACHEVYRISGMGRSLYILHFPQLGINPGQGPKVCPTFRSRHQYSSHILLQADGWVGRCKKASAECLIA